MDRNQMNESAQRWFEGQNKQLVFIDNGETVTDSLTVAEVFGKDHKHVLRDIRSMECSEEFAESNFGLSSYEDSTGRSLPKYIITQDGFSFLVMGYTGKEAARFKEMYINEFNRMRQQLQTGIDMKRLSPELQYMIKLEQRTDGIEQEVSALKNVVDNEVWITEAQRGQIRTAVNDRARHLLINGYGNAHFQGIYSTLKTHFGVSKYDKIPRKDFDIALEIIRGWFPKTRQSRA